MHLSRSKQVPARPRSHENLENLTKTSRKLRETRASAAVDLGRVFRWHERFSGSASAVSVEPDAKVILAGNRVIWPMSNERSTRQPSVGSIGRALGRSSRSVRSVG